MTGFCISVDHLRLPARSHGTFANDAFASVHIVTITGVDPGYGLSVMLANICHEQSPGEVRLFAAPSSSIERSLPVCKAEENDRSSIAVSGAIREEDLV